MNDQNTTGASNVLCCERCKCPLVYIKHCLIMTVSGRTPREIGAKAEGGPLEFKLYECRSCGEYKFFRQ